MRAELKIHVYPYDPPEVREQKRAAKKAFAALHKNTPVRVLGKPKTAAGETLRLYELSRQTKHLDGNRKY